MTCEDRRELFFLDAVGALEPAESQALRAHLAEGCPICAASASEALEMAALLPLALEQEQPSPDVLKSLMRRATVKKLEASRSPFSYVLTGALAACVAALITGVAMWRWLGDGHRLLTTPDLQYVAMNGSKPQPQARGRVFWDKDHKTWHVYFFDLRPPPNNRQYELWFITKDGQKLPAGTFDVDAHGNAKLMAAVPPTASDIAAAAVTDEQTGGSSSPTGAIQLLGKID